MLLLLLIIVVFLLSPQELTPPTINLLSCPSSVSSQAQNLHEIQPSYVWIKIHCCRGKVIKLTTYFVAIQSFLRFPEMKAVKAKMFSLMPESMKSYGESAVVLRREVELRMKMNSVRKIMTKKQKTHHDQMSWYERAKGRRKFRVNEEDEELVQVI